MRQVEVVYNRIATAIWGVSLTVESGSFTVILGTNGAGKTTTLKAVSGFIGADDAEVADGTVILEGEDITGMLPHQVAQRGVALVPEREKVFESLTIEENLRAAALAGSESDLVYDLFPRLGELRKRVAGYLSGGERQMLAMGMGLINEPRLLLVDELSLGLAPFLVQQLMGDLARINDQLGVTILLVEQNALAALQMADYGYVIEDGRIVFDGQPSKLLAHEDIKEFYLGTGGEGSRKSYRDVKQYRRKRRWWG